jgi:hypothetical protein
MSQVTAQSLPMRFVENDHFALDIDEPNDLERFLAYGYRGGESTRVALALLADQDAPVNRRSGGV